MIDREKVIEGLEETEIKLTNALNRSGAMSLMGAFRCLNSVTDAIALLKEYQEKQEGLPPAWQDRTQDHVCQKCGGIVWHEDNYCSKCGQALRWK